MPQKVLTYNKCGCHFVFTFLQTSPGTGRGLGVWLTLLTLRPSSYEAWFFLKLNENIYLLSALLWWGDLMYASQLDKTLLNLILKFHKSLKIAWAAR